ncbi:MAG: hypothetical protein IJT04_00040 [Bacteroidales bacterium]|nr:hypothetical protein [Bacteroidales bacterium]
MKNKLFLFGCVLLVFCFLSCKKSGDCIKSEKVQQENIFQFYQATYLLESDEMYLQAAFSVDNKFGQPIQLVDPSYVTFNGANMQWNEDGIYRTTIHGFTQELVFQYINNNSNPFLNRLEMNKMDVNRQRIVLNKNQRNVVGFQGEPLKESENMVCVLSQEENDSFEIDVDAEGRQIVILPEFIQEVPNGNYEGYFVRKNSCSDINAMDRGGLWETEYYSKKIQIIVE